MPEPLSLRFAFGLEPRRAVDYFRSKGYAVTFSWDSMEAAAHAKAFTVAKAMNLEVLGTIREEIERAIAQGATLAQFRERLRPRLEALGWWGKQVIERPDGTAQLVQTGSPRRLETIYRTNVQSAYMVGRYRALYDNREARPFWQYVAVMDSRTRPSHAALHARVFRWDDPIWDHVWPPNGYNCRCRVRALTAGEMRAKGLEASASGENLRIWQDADPQTGLVFDRVAYKGPGMQTAFSPDRGFAANAAKEGFQPPLEKYPADLRRAYINASINGPAFEEFMARRESTDFAVAVAGARLASALGVQEGAVVRLSAQTRDKQLAVHPELQLADYRLLPAVIRDAQFAVQQGETHIVLVRIAGGWWSAVVKRTDSGEAVFLQSFRRTNPTDAERLRRTGAVLWDDLPG